MDIDNIVFDDIDIIIDVVDNDDDNDDDVRLYLSESVDTGLQSETANSRLQSLPTSALLLYIVQIVLRLIALIYHNLMCRSL